MMGGEGNVDRGRVGVEVMGVGGTRVGGRGGKWGGVNE